MWDEGNAETKDTRRPDIAAFNPRDRRRYVIDVVGAWAVQPGIAFDMVLYYTVGRNPRQKDYIRC